MFTGAAWNGAASHGLFTFQTTELILLLGFWALNRLHAFRGWIEVWGVQGYLTRKGGLFRLLDLGI